MTSINNKQKFLAELGKLLTFMYDEDREKAVGMYVKMFEEARDESALIQSFVSPTRQAVIVARAYNSNHGKLSLYAGAKAAPEDRDDNGVPDYIQAIEGVRAQAWAAQGIPEEEESAETETAEEDAPAEEEREELPAAEEEGEESPAEEEAEEAPAAEVAEETPAAEEEGEESPAEAEPEEAPAEEAEEAPAGEEPPAAEEEGEQAPAAQEIPEEENAAESAQEPEGELRDNVEYFTIPAEGTESPEPAPDQTALSGNDFNVDIEVPHPVRRKPRVFLLILYILLAVPVTICGIALLLIPTVLFLALSLAAIASGVVLVSAAFKGFAVFADIMVLLGLALVIFAIGLFCLWTSIWFVGGAIVGLVHGVAALCDKWCYKEVPEE